MSDVDGADARVGVDVGGTFTDVVTVEDGALATRKLPSTPDAPDEAVVTGVEAAVDDGLDPGAVDFFGHGTTVATNAVLEREWAETALITTAGFRDALEIGRQTRPDIYDLRAEKPAPVVERDRRFEVGERLDERGATVTPLDEDDVRAVADRLAALDVESVAVSLLFAFENDEHERRVAAILDDRLDASVSLSSRVLPEIREYERTLATALNAALRPTMDRYVGRLAAGVRDLGVPVSPVVMQSGGGLMAAAAARERPVNTLLSGPAAGVQGAAHVADRAGVDDLLTMDMGGTSCDVSLVEGGDPLVTTDVTVGDYPVSVPAVDVHTVGAGGGSIAWIDRGGALRVGPRSAGAEPGPICYGRGGTEPTTTDAHYLLGRIAPERFLAEFDVDRDRVAEAVRERIADPLDRDVAGAAQGILDVANATMARALRVVSVERGYDPREFTLVAFGGAGPLHATALAAELGIPRVLVPRTAGVLSALGLLVSDVRYDHAVSRVRPLDAVEPGALEATFDDLEARGDDDLAAAEIPAERRRFERRADLRYVGQSFDLSVPVPDEVTASTADTLADRFHERHERRYGHADPDEPVEFVTARVRARGVVEPPGLAPPPSGGRVADARRERRAVRFDGTVRETPVYDRARLPIDAAFDGPAVVEGGESTVVVDPDQRVTVDDDANLLVEVTR